MFIFDVFLIIHKWLLIPWRMHSEGYCAWFVCVCVCVCDMNLVATKSVYTTRSGWTYQPDLHSICTRVYLDCIIRTVVTDIYWQSRIPPS